MTTETAPLECFRVIGVEEKTYQCAPGAPVQPAGTCWHCGTSIKVCVVSKNVNTGEIVDIGTTCAERIGLDPEGLKRYLRERREFIRAELWAADTESRRLHAEWASAEAARLHGEHGTESRYAFGCHCGECVAAAPHGTADHFWQHDCSCDACVEAVKASDPRIVTKDRDVLVDLSTGHVVDEARLIQGQYGWSWLIPSLDRFVPEGRKRRATIASRGYTYATASYLVRVPVDWRKGDWPLRRLTSPTMDDFGEAISS